MNTLYQSDKCLNIEVKLKGFGGSFSLPGSIKNLAIEIDDGMPYADPKTFDNKFWHTQGGGVDVGKYGGSIGFLHIGGHAVKALKIRNMTNFDITLWGGLSGTSKAKLKDDMPFPEPEMFEPYK